MRPWRQRGDVSKLNADDAREAAELADVIGEVRAELEEAQRRGRDSGMRFRVEKVTLEFAVQVRREKGAKGGLRIGVLTADAARTTTNDTTHRIQVELQPRGRNDDGPVDVGGESPDEREDD